MGPLNFPKPNEVLARHLAGLAKTPQVPHMGAAPMKPKSPWQGMKNPISANPATPMLPVPQTRVGGV